MLLPEGAWDVKIAANPGEIKTDDRVFTDVDGRRPCGWVAGSPGESKASPFRTTYRTGRSAPMETWTIGQALSIS